MEYFVLASETKARTKSYLTKKKKVRGIPGENIIIIFITTRTVTSATVLFLIVSSTKESRTCREVLFNSLYLSHVYLFFLAG